jgi:hypothetical protein
MLALLHAPTELHPLSAQEFALRVRQSEKRHALTTADFSMAGQPRKMALIDLLIHLFGAPTLF